MDYLEIVGTLVGLIYLWLEYKASIYLWIAGIVMPAIYIIVYYRAGLYADFGINIYYLGAAVYGYALWSFKQKGKDGNISKELSITRFPKKYLLATSLVFVAFLLAIAWVLNSFTDSNVVCADSFTTALSVIGLWMLARKFVEQWLVWIVVDVVCAVLYIYKGLFFTSVLYAIYSLIAIFGYIKWRKMIHDD